MTFQEWLQTEKGRMVSFEKMPRMLEIVWNAGAEVAEARAEQLSSRVWRIEPDEDGDNGETWRQAFIDCDMMRMQSETRVAELEAHVEALEAEIMQQHHIAAVCAEAEA